MKRSFQSRTLISLDVAGLRLKGTYHLPSPGEESATGILLLTGLATPRSAHGDSGVYWAEAFAASGYPAFRVDLPGSGDSEEGTLAESLSVVNAGGHGSIVAGIVDTLTRQYGLNGVILLGHCAGATSAMFATGNTLHCRGLILLAPYYHLSQALQLKARRSLIDWASRSRMGALLGQLYLRGRSVYRQLFGKALPGNTNLPLLARWKKAASAGLPILVLHARGPAARGTTGEFDYLNYLAAHAGSKSRIEVRTVEGAHHTFANHAGRAGACAQMEHWLSKLVPIQDPVRQGKEPAATTAMAEIALPAHREPAVTQVDVA